MKTREEIPLFLNEKGLLGIGVELGVQKGIFSEHLIKNWKGSELILIDIWREMPRESYNDVANVGQENQKDNLVETFNRIYPYGERVTIIRAPGEKAVKYFKDHTLDFVYIDANHGKEAVVKDIQMWWPKVKPKGYLCGHDYPFKDVNEAVNEFCKTNNLTPIITSDDWSSFLIEKI